MIREWEKAKYKMNDLSRQWNEDQKSLKKNKETLEHAMAPRDKSLLDNLQKPIDSNKSKTQDKGRSI